MLAVVNVVSTLVVGGVVTAFLFIVVLFTSGVSFKEVEEGVTATVVIGAAEEEQKHSTIAPFNNM